MVESKGPRPCLLNRTWNVDNFNNKVSNITPEPDFVPGLCQKQFLIFDRSGDETRMMVSPFLSHVQNRISLGKRTLDVYNANNENVEVEKKLIKKVDENSIFHEDTDEINALLYSDDSYDHDDEDDEVTSTDHSPLKVSEFADLVPSSDGLKKRPKFLDGGYKKSSLKLDDNDEVEEKKVKMRKTLKVLEEIVPGLKTKDPMIIIDGAIDYLKSLRRKAENLGLGQVSTNEWDL